MSSRSNARCSVSTGVREDGEADRDNDRDRRPTLSALNARSNALCLSSLDGLSVGEPPLLPPGEVCGDSWLLGVAERGEPAPPGNHFGCNEGVTGIVMREWMT